MEESLPKWQRDANELSCYLSLGPLSKFEFKWANRQIGISATQNGFATKIRLPRDFPGVVMDEGFCLALGLVFSKKLRKKWTKNITEMTSD